MAALPEGTLGHGYYRFLHDQGLSPAPFEDIPYDGDPLIRYGILRLRQTHDLWHVLTGYAMDTRGEILLHVVNHTSYHRGFVADLFYQVPGGVRPPTTDLPVYLREHPAA